MINEDRFWESAVAEAVRGDTPPDVTARVLAGLAEPEPMAKQATRRGRLLVLRLLGELAAAAAVVLAIGWLTGVLQWPEVEVPDTTLVELAAAPGTQYETVEGEIRLQQGWLLALTGTPPIRCGESVLEQVDGRVLVHASGVPTREQAEAVLGWLKANGLEGAMIMDSKRWAAGATLAALVLSGSALLDGERIQAQDEPKTDPARWFTVRTVMDIDKLPPDAKLVRGEGVSGAHLEFLASHEGIETIDFRACENLREEHIETLLSLKSLRTLDLRGARWDGEIDYKAFAELIHLKELAVDFQPEVMSYDGSWPPPEWDSKWYVTSSLESLSDSGVLITLGNLSEITGVQLADIAASITTLRELNLSNNTNINDADMKALAELQSLQVLNIDNCWNVTELGLAYLARKNRLSSLRLSATMTDAILYQLSRMTNLEELQVPYGFNNFPIEGSPVPIGERMQAAFEQFVTLQKLKRLVWDVPTGAQAKDYAPLARLKALTALALNVSWEASKLSAMEVAAVVPVSTIEFTAEAVFMVYHTDWLAEESNAQSYEKLAENQNVTELRLALYTSAMPETADQPGALPRLLAKLPKVKRIVFTLDDAGSVEFFKQYAKKHLANYQVDIEVR